MYCPHCKEPIRMLGTLKQCPRCNGAIRLYVDKKTAMLLFVPVLLIGLSLMRYLEKIGLDGIVGGLAAVVILFASMRLKKEGGDSNASTVNQLSIDNADGVKIYSQSGILIGAFFGGFVAAGYLISKNLHRLGLKQKSKFAFMLGILGTTAFFMIMVFLPTDRWQVPKATYYIPQLIIVAMLLNAYHLKDIHAHVKNNGIFESNWKAFGISLLCLLLAFAALLLIVILFDVPIVG